MIVPAGLALPLALLALAGCKREERELRLDPPVAAALDTVKLMPNGIGGGPQRRHAAASGRKPGACRGADARAAKNLSRPPLAALIPLLCAGCSGWQSALDPQGPQAQRLTSVIWLFVAICAAIWLLVML